MGCLKLSILDEQYKKTELQVSYLKKELTPNFCDWNVRKDIFVKYIDPDGKRFIDANGNRVNVGINKSGSLNYKFSKGTSDNVKSEFLNNHSPSLSAMANTKDGQSAIKFMNRVATDIKITPNNDGNSNANSTIFFELDESGNPIIFNNVYSSVTIIPYMGSINETANKQNTDVDEILGATMMVEAGHLMGSQIKLDNNKYKSDQQKYQKLFNKYVKFRYDYRTGKNQEITPNIFENNSEIRDIQLDKTNSQRLEEIKQ